MFALPGLLGLVDGGVGVLFCDLPEIGTGDPIVGRLILTIIAAIAEFESRRIGQRTREAIAAKKARDGRTGTGMEHPTVRKAVRVANRDRKARAKAYRAKMRPLITPLLDRGLKLHEIAAALNAKGHRTRHGRPWTYATVWRVLNEH